MEANATPSINPEAPNVDESKPTSDIEALYMKEMNKVSDQEQDPKAPQASNVEVAKKAISDTQ